MANEDNLVKTRPTEGLDPLAGGEKLYNPKSSDASHYESDDTELRIDEEGVKRAAYQVQPGQQPVGQFVPARKVKNKSRAEQAKVAKGRKEPKSK